MIDLSDRNALMRTLPQGGRVVEVGVEQGRFARVILNENHPRELYLVDAWSEQPGTDWQANDPVARSDHAANYKMVQQMFAQQPEVSIVRSLSVPAAAMFDDGSLDIVYLDADHTRAAEDIAAWWPKIRIGGWLCGHDYSSGEHIWVTVKDDVDRWIDKQGLVLSTTCEADPSWAVQRTCPVYINNRDHLTTTRSLVEYLRDVPGALPIIVDNGSTYGPLLEWYEQCGVEVVRVRNIGPRAPWKIKSPLMASDYYAVTDADLDLTGVPRDVLNVLRSGLDLYPDRIKAGLSLEIEDLPDISSTTIIQAWESRYWRTRLDEQWFDGDVDTTFALYRSGCEWPGIHPALRADRPYVARHMPWYRIDSDEQRYYEQHADPKWATWSNWNAPIATQPARARTLDLMRAER